jgi:hypothetical protein
MYPPEPNFVGQDRIIVHTVDSPLAAADSETIYVSISPIEHLPHIVVNKQQLIVHEDSILWITDISLEIGTFPVAESPTSAPDINMVQSYLLVTLSAVTLRRSGSDIWMLDFIATSPTYAATFLSMRMVASGSWISGGSFSGNGE